MLGRLLKSLLESAAAGGAGGANAAPSAGDRPLRTVREPGGEDGGPFPVRDRGDRGPCKGVLPAAVRTPEAPRAGHRHCRSGPEPRCGPLPGRGSAPLPGVPGCGAGSHRSRAGTWRVLCPWSLATFQEGDPGLNCGPGSRSEGEPAVFSPVWGSDLRVPGCGWRCSPEAGAPSLGFGLRLGLLCPFKRKTIASGEIREEETRKGLMGQPAPKG